MTVDLVERELACLRAIRAELAESYPRVRPLRVLSILRRSGLRRFPAGLLLDAPPSSPSPSGAFAMLFRAGRPRLARGLARHPLFSSEFYRAVNPDIVASGADPWLHFQVFGRTEGRVPHPLIDLDFLSQAMPATIRAELLDRYLADPALWTSEPGPYVECARFMLDGPWDGTTNPLVQVVRDHLSGPWVHQRLMLIDSQVVADARAVVIGAGILLARRGARAAPGALVSWGPASAGEDLAAPARYTVVPGFFVGAEGRTLSSNDAEVMSADSTLIRTGSGYLSLPAGDDLTVARLLVITADLEGATLASRAASASPADAIAPHSVRQYDALVGLGLPARILPYGTQVGVRADELELVAS